MGTLTLSKAKEILAKHTTENHLLVHAAAVSAAMEALAKHFGENEEHWAAIGWLHDVDYEKFPDEHCRHVRELLASEDVSEDDVDAIISHGYGLVTNERAPQTNMEKSLFAVDELTGIVHAYALMRPEKMQGMSVKSLKKKFKDKKFAAKCDRAVIERGCQELGMELGDVMSACIEGMSAHENELGL